MAARALQLEPDLLRLAGPFTSIARTMSQQWHVQIVPHGFRCDTDGNVIHIPFTSDYLPPAHRQLLHGMLDHEVCHVLEEREAKARGDEQTPLQMYAAEKAPIVKMLFNVFEDIRIESKWEVRYPGVAENLRALNEHGVVQFRKSAGRDSQWHRIGSAIIYHARGLETDWASDVAEHLERISDELEAARKMESASDALRLARRVYKKLKCDVRSDPASEALTDIVRLIQDDLEKIVRADVDIFARYVPDARAQKLDRWQLASPMLLPADAMLDYNEAYEDVRTQIGALRAHQIAHLQTISRSRVVGGLSEGQLDGAQLHSVRLGDRDVFSDVRRGRSLNTAVEVLIDFSGSMGASKYAGMPAYYAKRTAIALVETWEPLRIPNSFIGFFNNHERDPNRFAMASAEPSETATRAPFDFWILKDWHEPLSMCRRRFTVIGGYGDNADGEAVYSAACRLAQRKETRRILIVISDGFPAHHRIDGKVLNEHLRAVIKRVTDAGIEVIGVGAGTDAPEQFYNRTTGASSIIVHDLDKLALTLFGAMKHRLTGEGAVA